MSSFEKLLICYLPGLDLRRLATDACPHLATLAAAFPWHRLRTLPTVEHVATMLTGVTPDRHGLWGPKLVGSAPSWRSRLVDQLPDPVATTLQCVGHVLNGPVDLATMPPHRRRRFAWTRFKYMKHRQNRRVVRSLNGCDSIFQAVGEANGRYVYHDDFHRLDPLLAGVGRGDLMLEFVEVHCLDRLQHWRLDDETAIRGYYQGVDDFLAELHAKCQRNQVGFAVLIDHGQERVVDTIDLFELVAAADPAPGSLDLFIENTKATLWFHDDTIRRRVLARLQARPELLLFHRADMRCFDLMFDDDDAGEIFVYPQPGVTFFPNDFHQPLTSAVLAMTDWQQRPRLYNPRHRGDHGYLPDHRSEEGLLLLAEDGYQVVETEARLVDVAPTILDLLGCRAPVTMQGRPLFAWRPQAAQRRDHDLPLAKGA